MARRSNRYRADAERVDRTRAYPPRRALQLVKETATVAFDPTVDIALNLGIDPRQADQMVRGAIVLPHGTGKTAVVAVVAAGEKASQAREAGADYVGTEELIEKLGDGTLVDELDAVIAPPDQMSKLGPLGKVLGPRGLMPNPKSGTMTTEVGRVVEEVKAGKIEYRSDRYGNVHAVLGKASFTVDMLMDNYQALVGEITRQRPAAAKGRYLRAVTVSTSMGPGVRVDPRPSAVLADARAV